ncbi:putative Rft protein [Blattamonas nauphoetae]|uniref:Protein RFT1 homolog n=1 Tax=Blattamonas nauphoetae TaxID=2049346 RepID=A0ABQ9YL30_9EUKA|nr:putative Rft protein [Blattamonas nauphoetae]
MAPKSVTSKTRISLSSILSSTLLIILLKGATFFVSFKFSRVVKPDILGIVSTFDLLCQIAMSLVVEPIRTYSFRAQLYRSSSPHETRETHGKLIMLSGILFVPVLSLWYAVLRPKVPSELQSPLIDVPYFLSCVFNILDNPLYILSQTKNHRFLASLSEALSHFIGQIFISLQATGESTDFVVISQARLLEAFLSFILLLSLLMFTFSRKNPSKSTTDKPNTALTASSLLPLFSSGLGINMTELRTIISDSYARSALNFSFDTMTSKLLTFEQQGVLSQAKRILALIASMVFAPAERRVFEELSKVAHSTSQKGNRQKDLFTQTTRLLRASFYVGFLFFPFLTAISPEVALVVFGRQWMDTTDVVQLQTLSFASMSLMPVNGIVEAVVRATMQTASLTKNNIIMTIQSVVMLPVTFWLGTKYHSVGFILSTIISMASRIVIAFGVLWANSRLFGCSGKRLVQNSVPNFKIVSIVALISVILLSLRTSIVQEQFVLSYSDYLLDQTNTIRFIFAACVLGILYLASIVLFDRELYSIIRGRTPL